MKGSVKEFLSKADTFEAGLGTESPVRELEKFGELENIVTESLKPQQPIQKVAPPKVEHQNLKTPDFALSHSRWVQTQPPMSRPAASDPAAFSKNLRARAQARASFSRAGIIKQSSKKPGSST